MARILKWLYSKLLHFKQPFHNELFKTRLQPHNKVIRFNQA